MSRGQLSAGFIAEVAIAIVLLASSALLMAQMGAAATHSFHTVSAAYAESGRYLNASFSIYGAEDIFGR